MKTFIYFTFLKNDLNFFAVFWRRFCAWVSSSSSSIRKSSNLFKPLFWFKLKHFFCKISFKNEKIFYIKNNKFKLCSKYSLDEVKLYILIPVLRENKELRAAAVTHTHAHTGCTYEPLISVQFGAIRATIKLSFLLAVSLAMCTLLLCLQVGVNLGQLRH